VSVARRIAWNTSVQTAARVGTLTLAVLTTALLTRHFGVGGYGTYVTVTVYVMFFAVFFDWGITTLLSRELAVDPDPRLFGAALALRTALSLTVALVALGLAFLVYRGAGDAGTREGILVAFPIIVLNGIGTVPSALFQARLKMDRYALAEIAAQAVTAGAMVLVILLGWGLDAVLAATVAGALVNAALLVFFARRLIPFTVIVDPALWRRLLRLALPLGVSVMIATIYFRADAILLSLLVGAKAVGIYGVAYRLIEGVIAFPGFFVLSVFPLLTAAARAGDLQAVRVGTQRAFDVLVLAAMPVVLGTIALAPELVDLLAGSGFADAATPLRIVIAGAGLTFLNLLFAYTLIAIGEQLKVLWISAAVLAFNVALNVALIPQFTYNAAASVATASEGLSLLSFLIVVRITLGFRPSLGIAAKGAFAGGAMFLALLFLPTSFVPSALIGLAVYSAALFLLRTHESLELRELLRVGGKS
jgi:O-antigen/teichoic acid export membrane protein